MVYFFVLLLQRRILLILMSAGVFGTHRTVNLLRCARWFQLSLLTVPLSSRSGSVVQDYASCPQNVLYANGGLPGYVVTNPIPITNPSEPIGNIPGPVDLIERAGACESEETWLAAVLLGCVTLSHRDL